MKPYQNTNRIILYGEKKTSKYAHHVHKVFNFFPAVTELITVRNVPNVYFANMPDAAKSRVQYLAFSSYVRPEAKTDPCYTFPKVTELALENTPMTLVSLAYCRYLIRAWFRGNVLPGNTVKTFSISSPDHCFLVLLKNF